jgi:MOSC domain-containing protein YiiM
VTTARVVSVNVGAIRQVEWEGEVVSTAIWKSPVRERIALRGVNLAGDEQADRTVHGGHDKAVYAYSQEDYDFWREEHGVETRPGLFGENLTVDGIDLSAAIVGERWRVGSCLLGVTQPRLPCYKLGMRMGDPYFPRRFQAAMRMGAYFRVIEEGDIGVNDAIAVVERPTHGVTLHTMVGALHDPVKARALREVEDLPGFWRRVADRLNATIKD